MEACVEEDETMILGGFVETEDEWTSTVDVDEADAGAVVGVELKLNKVTQPMTTIAETNFHWLKHWVAETLQKR